MNREPTRMLLLDPAARWLGESTSDALPALLRPTDLLVVNDAATLPASLHVHSARGQALELRLLEAPHSPYVRAVLLGEGDFSTPTELRPAPPRLLLGDTLQTSGLTLTVAHVSRTSPRLVILRWPGPSHARFAQLYAHGRPVQYSYVATPLSLWDVQTSFAARPWAVEMPSAGRPLHPALLLELQRRGVRIATLTHAAGLSATGDPALDALLPLPERYELAAATVQHVLETRRAGGRVIAVGTSVVRALEDCALRHGALQPGPAAAELVLDATTRRRVVDGLLTGIHVPGESHYRLLECFVDGQTLARSVLLAQTQGYRSHEFGDAALIVPGLAAQRTLAA